MPRYAALIYSPAETEGVEISPEQMQEVMSEYNEFSEAAAVAGVMAGGEALHDTTTATTIRVKGRGGEAVFTDGPFAETKEVLGGFYLLDASDLDEALKWAQQIPGAWRGTVEVRPCVEFEG
ncbi:MAG TPA: YciI family protein [Acidimicrobiia bacterium]